MSYTDIDQPLGQDLAAGLRDALEARHPPGTRVLWCSDGDAFSHDYTDEQISEQFAVMACRPDLRFAVTTEYPLRAMEWCGWLTRKVAFHLSVDDASWLRDPRRPDTDMKVLMCMEWLGRLSSGPLLFQDDVAKTWPLPNVAIGVRATTQSGIDHRVPLLLQVPAAMRYAEIGPMRWPTTISSELLDGLDLVVINGDKDTRVGWVQDIGFDVLDAQEMCPICDDTDDERPRTIKCTRCNASGRVGPALFIAQADVCDECNGEPPGAHTRECAYGNCNGQTGKVRDCPQIHIPGHGIASRQQCPTGWDAR